MSKKFFSIIPIIFAVALPFWQSTFEYGWLDMVHTWLFWFGATIWFFFLIYGIRVFKHWWLLLTVPIVAYPAGIYILLSVGCRMFGECL